MPIQRVQNKSRVANTTWFKNVLTTKNGTNMLKRTNHLCRHPRVQGRVKVVVVIAGEPENVCWTSVERDDLKDGAGAS
jgi:hypothetical protein